MLENVTIDGGIVAGCDEAGRGCLAGPVVAAAVVLPSDFFHPMLNDSKKLSLAHRNLLQKIIQEKALYWAIGIVEHDVIDKINILNASILAMHKALDGLQVTVNKILVDGNRFKQYKDISHQCIIKGDAKITQIAAASILAKTHRDAIMHQIHLKHPHYAWNKNMGYPTKLHLKGMELHGLSPYHRLSYKPVKQFII
jgi:ribonuclease HII